jgi:hypothetical protein
MAVSVILNLADEVSVEDLKQFLSFVPEGFDLTHDLTVQFKDASTDDLPCLLQIMLPLPRQQEQGQGTQPLDPQSTT